MPTVDRQVSTDCWPWRRRRRPSVWSDDENGEKFSYYHVGGDFVWSTRCVRVCVCVCVFVLIRNVSKTCESFIYFSEPIHNPTSLFRVRPSHHRPFSWLCQMQSRVRIISVRLRGRSFFPEYISKPSVGVSADLHAAGMVVASQQADSSKSVYRYKTQCIGNFFSNSARQPIRVLRDMFDITRP